VLTELTSPKNILYLLAAMALATYASIAVAQNSDTEIEYLLTAIGSSNCIFIRNGSQHSAEDAESHLRMKYGKTRRHIDDADEFVTKLASESSWTGKPYTLDCPDTETQTTKIWLLEKLAEYRVPN
jgi:hypothetical protein